MNTTHSTYLTDYWYISSAEEQECFLDKTVGVKEVLMNSTALSGCVNETRRESDWGGFECCPQRSLRFNRFNLIAVILESGFSSELKHSAGQERP